MPQRTSENQIIGLLQTRYAARHRWLAMGMGDDAAVVRLPGARELLALTTDMLLEAIDFRREWITPRQLGYKSMAVNLSDLAAMGVRPRGVTVALALPAGATERWIRQFYDGLTECGARHGAALLGGDLSSSKGGIMVSITAVGESVHRKILYRSGGRPGDGLYVTGTLGRSAAGLKLLQDGIARSRQPAQREALRRHLTPEPRCGAGQWLAQSGLAHCLMDLSDGLSRDLPRMCAASRVDAVVYTDRLPVFAASRAWHCDPLAMALHGGEDYELLFAVPKARQRRLEQSYPAALPPIARIGELAPGDGTVWVSEPGKQRRRLPIRAFDHFAT